MKSEKGFIVKLGLILFSIVAICVFALSLCNTLTKDKIEEINLKKVQDSKIAVLSDADTFEDANFLNDDNVEIYIGKKSNEKIGYCVNVAPKGYNGEINMMVGLDNDLKVMGVTIINMSETPGLGAKAKDDKFIKQYNGLLGTDGEIGVIKSGQPNGNEVACISGATITSKAVTKGVNDAITAVKDMEGIQ